MLVLVAGHLVNTVLGCHHIMISVGLYEIYQKINDNKT